jgi:hypothetical protein
MISTFNTTHIAFGFEALGPQTWNSLGQRGHSKIPTHDWIALLKDVLYEILLHPVTADSDS